MQGSTNSLRMFGTAVSVLKMCQPAPNVPRSTIHVYKVAERVCCESHCNQSSIVAEIAVFKMLSLKCQRRYTNGCLAAITLNKAHLARQIMRGYATQTTVQTG